MRGERTNLSHKHKELSLGPPNPLKLDVIGWIYKPSTHSHSEMESGHRDLWKAVGQLAWHMQWLAGDRVANKTEDVD